MPTSTSRFDRRALLKTGGAASILAASAHATRSATLATTPTASPVARDLDAAITETMKAMGIPGANVLVERAGSGPWVRGFGVADLEAGTPMDPAMHMRLGSITKTMTATVVLQLVEEGALSLDDTLAATLPDLAAVPYAKEVTVRHLLGMTSGVFDVLDDVSFFGQVIDDPSRAWTPTEMIDLAFAHEPTFAPGEDFAYSNTNYILLGMIVENITGQPIGDVLARSLFEPLGMMHTSLPTSPELPEPFARGYSVDLTGQSGDLIDWTELNPTVAWAAGGVVSTLGDLHTWLRALVDGSLISASLQRERMTFTAVRPGYGYGLGIADYAGMIGHEGSILGYHSFAGHDTGTRDTVIVLANLDPAGGDEDAATAIAEAIRDRLDQTA